MTGVAGVAGPTVVVAVGRATGTAGGASPARDGEAG